MQVGIGDGTVPAGRLLEYTDEATRASLSADFGALQDLPVLSMPEVDDDRFEQVARIASAVGIKRDGRDHRFRLIPDPRFPPVPLTTIQELAGELGIGGFELRRTHWAVKNVDLFEVLLAHQIRSTHRASGDFGPGPAIQFPVESPRDPGLVGVMMPFAPAFDVVYETIEAAVADVGLRCVRADDIWQHQHVMGDIVSILWRSEIVIADLTAKNANVFYEAGLAHALPRATILLTQDSNDVPFDLQSIRYLRYGLGTEERGVLRRQLAERLRTLTTRGASQG